MDTYITRRHLIRAVPCGLAASVVAAPANEPTTPGMFPLQPPEVVHEVVVVSHSNFQRVRELVEAHPSLAKASWDWGFGDHETALGAASHTGQRQIAEYLIAHGAAPTLFSAAMLGQLDVVKAIVAANPGAQRIPGPHSIRLRAHAVVGGAGAEPVLRYLDSLGDAGAPPVIALTAEQAKTLAGTYRFGSGAADQIDITEERTRLTFTRAGTVGRPLVHLGDQTFHPAGAEAVRIRFTQDGAGIVLTVHDPGVVLTARRS